MRWKQEWVWQDAVARSTTNTPRDALAKAMFGRPATGGQVGKQERMARRGYRELCEPLLDEVQRQGHPSICAFGAQASQRDVERMFMDANVARRARDLDRDRTHAMSHPFKRRERTAPVEPVITDDMRAAWADEAARREEMNATHEFDWDPDIAANPLGVSTGP